MDLRSAVLQARADLAPRALAIGAISAETGASEDRVAVEWETVEALLGPPSLMDPVRIGLADATRAARAIESARAGEEIPEATALGMLEKVRADRLRLLALAEKVMPPAPPPRLDDTEAHAAIARFYGGAQ